MSYSNGLGNLQHLLGNLATNASTNAKATEQAQTGTAAPEAVAGSKTSDATRLSTASGVVGKALAGSDVRTDKVAALQQSIAAGTYHVSASDVATSIIASLLG